MTDREILIGMVAEAEGVSRSEAVRIIAERRKVWRLPATEAPEEAKVRRKKEISAKEFFNN